MAGESNGSKGIVLTIFLVLFAKRWLCALALLLGKVAGSRS